MRSPLLHGAASALARRLVRGYPRPWRNRYEDELLALLDDSPARLRDVFDLARGLVVERARATFEPADRPELLSALVALRGVARGIALMSVPVMAGWGVKNWLGAAPHAVGMGVAIFQVPLMIIFMVRSARMSSQSDPAAAQAAIFSNRAGHLWLGVLITTTFLLSWSWPLWEAGSTLLFQLMLVENQMSRPRPWQLLMSRAIHNLRAARHEMKWARLELERCERLAAEGAPAPLAEARDAIADITRRRDEAIATLNGLGYRATLQNDPSINA